MSKSSFGFQRAEDSPGFLLWQVTSTWQRKIKQALEPFDVSHAQFVMMAVLLWLTEHHEEVTQVKLIDWTKLDKMTVSKSLKKLSAMGFVQRAESIDDSRAKSVKLTPSGKKLIKKLVPIIEKIDVDFFSPLNKQELKQFIHYSRTISSMTR